MGVPRLVILLLHSLVQVGVLLSCGLDVTAQARVATIETLRVSLEVFVLRLVKNFSLAIFIMLSIPVLLYTIGLLNNYCCEYGDDDE